MKTRKLLAVILSALMIFSVLPLAVFAVEPETGWVPVAESTEGLDEGEYFILDPDYLLQLLGAEDFSGYTIYIDTDTGDYIICHGDDVTVIDSENEIYWEYSGCFAPFSPVGELWLPIYLSSEGLGAGDLYINDTGAFAESFYMSEEMLPYYSYYIDGETEAFILYMNGFAMVYEPDDEYGMYDDIMSFVSEIPEGPDVPVEGWVPIYESDEGLRSGDIYFTDFLGFVESVGGEEAIEGIEFYFDSETEAIIFYLTESGEYDSYGPDDEFYETFMAYIGEYEGGGSAGGVCTHANAVDIGFDNPPAKGAYNAQNRDNSTAVSNYKYCPDCDMIILGSVAVSDSGVAEEYLIYGGDTCDHKWESVVYSTTALEDYYTSPYVGESLKLFVCPDCGAVYVINVNEAIWESLNKYIPGGNIFAPLSGGGEPETECTHTNAAALGFVNPPDKGIHNLDFTFHR